MMGQGKIAILLRVNDDERRDGWVFLPRGMSMRGWAGRRDVKPPQIGRDYKVPAGVRVTPPKWLSSSDLMFPVARVTRAQRERLDPDLKKTSSGREWTRITSTFQTRDAINRNDIFTALKEAANLRRVRPVKPQELTSSEEAFAHMDLFFMVAEEQNRYLKGAQLVLWAHHDPSRIHKLPRRDGKQWVRRWSLDLGVLCRDLKTVLFVYAALGELRPCPCCGNLFVPGRPKQDYCSVRCRETYRKRRLRAKAKAKQGGK